MPWAPLNETDFYYARMPFAEAQAKLGETKGSGVARRVTCGWHGTSFDPERGAFAIVNPNGALADLLGERLQVSYADAQGKVRSVYVYAHRSSEASAAGVTIPVGQAVPPPRILTVLPSGGNSGTWSTTGAGSMPQALGDSTHSSYISNSAVNAANYNITAQHFLPGEAVASVDVISDYNVASGQSLRFNLADVSFNLLVASSVLTGVGVDASVTISVTPTVPYTEAFANGMTVVITNFATGLSKVYDSYLVFHMTQSVPTYKTQIVAEDISLPRRAFAAISPLSNQQIPVVVSVCPAL